MDIGLFITDDPAKILAPVANETWILNLTTGQLSVFNGVGYTVITGGGGAVSQGPIITSGLTQATGKLLGRNTALTGAIEEITLGTNLSFSGTTLNASGGGSGGLTLVEKKTLTADTTSVTFSSLDGNTDGVYKFIGRIKTAAASNTIDIRPNGATTNLTSQILFSGGVLTSSNIPICQAVASGQWLTFEIVFNAKNDPNSVAMPRFAVGHVNQVSGTGNIFIGLGGMWNETSTNITSFDVTSNQTNGIGDGSEIALYKYAQ